MTFDEQAATLDRKEVAALLASHQDITATSRAQSEEIAELRRQLEWFKRQLFGSTSERRLVDPDGRQLSLGEWKTEDAPGAEITVAEHRRRSTKRRDDTADEDQVRFEDSVPVEEIRIVNSRPKGATRFRLIGGHSCFPNPA